MSNTKIEWTDKVWNPVTGCTPMSAGCDHCWAKRFAHRLKENPKAGSKYHDDFNPTSHEDELSKPGEWNKPKKVFVCSMGDLFHEKISFEFIEAFFSIMSDIDRHTYLILTKRPQRMLEFYNWKNDLPFEWRPKDNIWLGVSIEDQKTADERIPILLKIPAAKRFISAEPLLGEISIYPLKYDISWFDYDFTDTNRIPLIHWVICGGETGPGARPMHPDWARSLRDQCKNINRPFFYKSCGEWVPSDMNIKSVRINKQLANKLRICDGEVYMRRSKFFRRDLLDGNFYHEFPKP